jgi:YjbE family integral membrane protein
MISASELSALLQVIMVDLVLAGDNAIVVGMVAAGLPPAMRARVIMIGIVAATLMRVSFALVTAQLLQIIGLLLAGGLLLLWVCWKLWREIQSQRKERAAVANLDADGTAEAGGNVKAPPKTFGQAVVQIVIADVSMSLDNVLAVAGAAREHTWVLIVGLALSVAFMAVAATFIARLLQRHHWIAYIGLAVILYIAGSMIWDGTIEVMEAAEVSGLM